MADEKKYLEGNYDGEPVQQAVQMAADVVRANKAQKEIRETQKRAYEIFEDECIDLKGITSEEFERKMESVDKNDSLHQYLVDGALLTCTMATLDDFEVDSETSVKLEIETLEEGEKRRQTFLSVMENAMYIGESCYATVKDTIINRNIFPFRCNCRQKADRMSEIERIKNNIADCRENGVCQYLICLNEEWDNMLLSDGKTYQMHRNIKAVDSVSGAGWILGGIDTEIEDVEGITRTSVLFCKHGGLIVPLTSGQENNGGEDGEEQYKNDVRYQRLLIEAERRKGNIEEYKIEFVLEVFPKILVDEARSGIPAEITFGQICLESSYGGETCVDINTGINGYNYFGIKGIGPAGSVTCNTSEEISGNKVPIVDDFRAYNSMDESIQDHSDLLVKYYQQYITTGSIEDWCDALNMGGYATASNYKELILGVCRTWDIIQ